MLGLNVGSGQRRFGSGWVNLDCISREGQVPDVLGVGEHLPFQNGSFSHVCLHHVLEHYGCGEGKELLKECWRVLKVGGGLTICVPDMKELPIGS